jgi:hypothetical protein
MRAGQNSDRLAEFAVGR